MKECGHLAAEEPFDGLFTQGMVTHETYRAGNGAWLSPDDVAVATPDGKRIATIKTTGEPAEIGPIEKMSKSKKNTIDPEDIIAQYGADTARWFMLSDSPPERDVEWTEAGVDGAWRFVQRLWNLIDETCGGLPQPGTAQPNGAPSTEAAALRKETHRCIASVTQEIERFRFNRAVAHIYELSNAIRKSGPMLQKSEHSPDRWILAEALGNLVKLFAPMMPHLAEACWERLGGRGLIIEQSWPEAEVALLAQDEIIIAIQINGKKRAELVIHKGTAEESVEAAALKNEKVIAFLDGRSAKKVIVVPDRIVNIVV
jgi:leucyl-tRNA synthetase